MTADLIVRWNFDEVAPEVMLEEFHTGCELVLERLVNRRSRRLSFAELVAAAANQGLLDGDDFITDPPALLLGLKDLRRDVRHRAAEGSDAWLRKNWEGVAILLERLVRDLNRHDADVDASGVNSSDR